jgi:Gpi18-like mannosyltransferase
VLLASGLVLLGPTVVVNSALWGQVDAAWVAPLLAALTCVLTRRPWLGMALLGLALALKLQSVFLVPAFAVLVLTRQLPLRALVAAPAAYLLAFVPAVLAGRSPDIVWSIYAGQAGTYPAMTLNAPNLWQLLPDRPELFATPATLVTATLVLALVALLSSRPEPLQAEGVLRIALVFALLCPYLLPHMHERYFFAADVLAVLYAVVRPARWWLPLLVVSASLLSYVPYLYATPPAVPFPVLSLMMGLALLVVLRDAVAPPGRPHWAHEAPLASSSTTR